MSAARRATHQHYLKIPFRYNVTHFGLNRAQRRSGARRDPQSGKLLTPPSHNTPYVHQDPIEEPTDA